VLPAAGYRYHAHDEGAKKGGAVGATRDITKNLDARGMNAFSGSDGMVAGAGRPPQSWKRVVGCAIVRGYPDDRGCGSPADMSRPTIKEINFVDFKRILEQAAAAGTRVEKSDKARWSAFVTQSRVKEAGFIAYARSHSESLTPVIVDDSGPNGGYYLYSERDEVCLKWIPRAE